MVNLPFTCKNCPDRHTYCHSSCKKYLAEKAEHERRKAIARADNEAMAYTVDAVRAQRDRSAKRRKGIASALGTKI